MAPNELLLRAQWRQTMGQPVQRPTGCSLAFPWLLLWLFMKLLIRILIMILTRTLIGILIRVLMRILMMILMRSLMKSHRGARETPGSSQLASELVGPWHHKPLIYH